MLEDEIEYERTTCDCNCNIFREQKPLTPFSQYQKQHQKKQVLKDQIDNQNKHQEKKNDKISLASYRKRKERHSFNQKQFKDLYYNQYKTFQIEHKQNYQTYYQKKISLIDKHKISENLPPRPPVYSRTINPIQTLKREYSKVTNFQKNNIYQPKIRPVSTKISKYQIGLFQQEKVPSSNLIEQKVPNQPSIKYLNSNYQNNYDNKNQQTSTQSSNFLRVVKTQQPFLTLSKKSTNAQKIDIQRPIITHFRAIQSVSGLTQQSQDRISEVLSNTKFQYDPIQHRNSNLNTHFQYGLQKIRNQNRNKNSSLFLRKRASQLLILSNKF